MNIKDIGNSVVKDVQSKQHKSAAKKIRSLIDANADLKNNWGGITRLAITIGEYKLAKICSEKFLAVAPNETKRIIQCAAILAEMRQVETAIALVTPLLTKDRTPEVLHFLGTTYAQIGKLKEAKEYLVELLDIAPKTAISWLTLATIHKFDEKDELFIKLKKNSQTNNAAPLSFALGKACLDTQEHQSAFLHFEKGNKAMAKSNNYESSQHNSFVNNIIKHQNKSFFDNIPTAKSHNKSDPVFIIGLPRSGTTLLQQLLSAHSKLNEGGELRCLSYPTMELGQQKINNLNSSDNSQQQEIIENIKKDYFYYLEQQFDSELPCIDKTLNLNHHIGIISKSFPKASIIRVVREPQDNAWSCYRTFFNQGVSWSYDLKNIAEFFYHENRLSNHWGEILQDKILEISYADLVNKPMETLTKCMTHLGLTFENEMLSFYKRDSLVQTASVKQVRSPINTDSINNSKLLEKELTVFSSHYRDLLNQ